MDPMDCYCIKKLTNYTLQIYYTAKTVLLMKPRARNPLATYFSSSRSTFLFSQMDHPIASQGTLEIPDDPSYSDFETSLNVSEESSNAIGELLHIKAGRPI